MTVSISRSNVSICKLNDNNVFREWTRVANRLRLGGMGAIKMSVPQNNLTKLIKVVIIYFVIIFRIFLDSKQLKMQILSVFSLYLMLHLRKLLNQVLISIWN